MLFKWWRKVATVLMTVSEPRLIVGSANAAQGVFEHLSSKDSSCAPKPVGLELMVDGTVPEGGFLQALLNMLCIALCHKC